MSDDKFKLIYDIMQELEGCELTWKVNSCGKNRFYFLPGDAKLSEISPEEVFNSANELIQYLKEQLKPKPKFAVGDVVYFVINRTIRQSVVKKVIETKNNNKFEYATWKAITVAEKYLFSTRQEAIEAQIEHWTTRLQGIQGTE